MAHTIINPDGLHDPTGFGYSHVACASGDFVFIAGQYASDGDVTSPRRTSLSRSTGRWTTCAPH
jgi:hypothetical protein